MRVVNVVLFAAAIAVLLAVLDLHRKGRAEEADFFLRVITGFGVLFAVVVALFGERIKTVFNKIHLEIEEPRQSDSFLNLHGPRNVFCHHLRVNHR